MRLLRRTGGGSGRLTGVDAARGVAILGMLWAHFAPDGVTEALPDGRASVLFATLAGLSLGLLSGGAEPPASGGRARTIRMIAIRAVVLIVFGRLLWSLNTTIAVILDYYGAFFLVLLPVLFASRAALAAVVAFALTAGALLIGGQPADHLNAAFGGGGGPVAWPGQWFVSGFYPGLLWIGYLAAGLLCARSDLRRRRTQLAMIGGGALACAAGYGGGALLGVEVFAHSNSTWEGLGAGGLAVAVIGLLQLASAARPVRILLSPVVDLGAMPLTVYAGQVIALAALMASVPGTVNEQGRTEGWGLLAGMAAASLLFAAVWRRTAGRGPLEQLMADVSGAGGAGRGSRGRHGPIRSTEPERVDAARVVAVAPTRAEPTRAEPTRDRRTAEAPARPAPPERPERAERPPRAFGRRGSLLRTSVLRRPLPFLGLALLVAGAVVVATASPLLLRIAQQSSLAAAGERTSPAAVVRVGVTDAGSDPEGTVDLLRPKDLWRAESPVGASGEALAWRERTESVSRSGRLTADDGCRSVRIVAGACPRSSDDPAVTPEAAVSRGDGIPVGARIVIAAGSGTVAAVVVGVYAPGSDGGPFRPAPVVAALQVTDPGRHEHDLLLASAALDRMQVGTITTVAAVLTRPLRLEDTRPLLASVRRVRTALAGITGAALAAPIESTVRQERTTGAAAALIALTLALQTLAVAWTAQALFVGAVARSRAGEWGVARLRGFGLGRRLVAVFAEPLLALALGGVVGYGLAALLAQAVGVATSGRAAVQPFEPLPLAIAGLALAGCLVALALASIRSATLPLARLLREQSEPRRLGRLSLVGQSGVLLATALVLYAALTGGALTGAQLPLLAPALIAVSAGLVGLRLAVLLLRGRAGTVPHSLFGLLVGRRLARTGSLLTIAVVLCVAVALAAGATQTAWTAVRLQRLRAEALVGADRVLDVAVPAGTDLLAAVRAADPGGRVAMAAEEVTGTDGPQHVVAVDTARLAAVAAWHPAWSGRSAAALRRALVPRVEPTLRLTGNRIAVDLRDVARIREADNTESSVPLSDLRLSLVVDTGSGWRTVLLGPLNRERFAAGLPCARGCRVVGLTVADVGMAQPWSARFTVTSLRTERGALALSAADWRPQIDPSSALARPPRISVADAGGLSVQVASDESRAVTGIAAADSVQPLPVLVGPRSAPRAVDTVPGADYGSGLGLEPLLVTAVGRASVLPRALGDGALADLTALGRVSDVTASGAQPQVWLSAAAGPRVVRALERRGLRVLGVERLADVEAANRAGTVSTVAVQGAAVGGAGVLLAVIALLLVRLLRRPRLAVTGNVLATAGAPSRVFRRIAVAEAVLPAAAGAVVGTAAGVTGAELVLRVLPLTAGAGVVPPLDTAITPLALLPAAAALLLVLVVGLLTAPRGRA